MHPNFRDCIVLVANLYVISQQSDRNRVYDNMLMELEEKVRKLEEERGMKQYNSGLLIY
jgi:hypothetical protein